MSFPARVFRLLIASPSDVAEERDIAVRTIQEWNDLNAAERQLVLLPLRWETHSAPEYGKRPQEIINRQVVDFCDLLIGIFWTRVGSPTGSADSGTIEEIERVANLGRPVMLYFSQVKQDPERIDLEQLAKLRDFKKKTFPTALVEAYSGPVEFKDKLSRQLEIQLRSLLAAEAESEADSYEVDIKPVTDIVIHFADPLTGDSVGTNLTAQTRLIKVDDFVSIPDYSPAKTARDETTDVTVNYLRYIGGEPNKDFFRQQVTYQVLQAFFVPIRFWLKNRGGVGARDVHIDVVIQSEGPGVVVVGTDELPESPPSSTGGAFTLSRRHASKPDPVLSKASNNWRTQFEVEALQPQRELSPGPQFLIGAPTSCDVTMDLRVYADTLPEPLIQRLALRLEVDETTIRGAEIIRNSSEAQG